MDSVVFVWVINNVEVYVKVCVRETEKYRDRQIHTQTQRDGVWLKEPLVFLEYFSMVWMGSHFDGETTEPLSYLLFICLFIFLFNLFPVLARVALAAMSQVT